MLFSFGLRRPSVLHVFCVFIELSRTVKFKTPVGHVIQKQLLQNINYRNAEKSQFLLVGAHGAVQVFTTVSYAFYLWFVKNLLIFEKPIGYSVTIQLQGL